MVCAIRGMPHAPPGETKRSRATGGGAEAMEERCNSFGSSENLDSGVSRSLWGGGKTDQARGGPGPRQPGDGGIQRPTSNRLRCAGSGALNRPGGGPGSRTSPPPCGWEAFAPSTRSTRDDPRPAEIRPRGIQRCLREGREDRRATAIHRRHAPASDSEDGPNFPNAKQWQQRAAGRSARDV